MFGSIFLFCLLGYSTSKLTGGCRPHPVLSFHHCLFLCSTVFFWDLRSQKPGFLQPLPEKKTEDKIITCPSEVPTTFKHLDLSWRPHMKVQYYTDSLLWLTPAVIDCMIGSGSLPDLYCSGEYVQQNCSEGHFYKENKVVAKLICSEWQFYKVKRSLSLMFEHLRQFSCIISCIHQFVLHDFLIFVNQRFCV